MAKTTMEGVINLDLIYDLRDDAERGPGYRRDHLTGQVFYSAKWLDKPRERTVRALPPPDLALVAEAARLAEGGPRDPEGARIIELQARTRPEDGWIGPRKTMLGLVPTEDERVRHSALILVDSLRSAARAAERLARFAGVGSPIRTNAEGSARGLRRLADRVEQETR